jgi:hypothetical protein
VNADPDPAYKRIADRDMDPGKTLNKNFLPRLIKTLHLNEIEVTFTLFITSIVLDTVHFMPTDNYLSFG